MSEPLLGLAVRAGRVRAKFRLLAVGASRDKGRLQQAYQDGKVCFRSSLTYEKYKGPIPNGLQIDHLCGSLLRQSSSPGGRHAA